jgi:hypothetical protein
MLRCMSLWLFVHGMAVYGGSADRDLRSQKLGANVTLAKQIEAGCGDFGA